MYQNLIALLAAVVLPISAHAQSAPPTKAAWIYVTPVLAVGWTHQHEQGRLAVQRAFGDAVRTTHVDDVAEGPDAERVLRDLARQGNDIIFTTSFGYMEPALRVARDFPDVKFEVITGVRQASNVAIANARYYEGRYLSGVVAGRMTRSNVTGYIAGFPIPEVLQGVNAFALGLRSVNPRATVKLIWLNSWFDPARERDAAMTLINEGADVLTFNTASTAIMAAAEERHTWAIAYHSDMRSVAPAMQLAAVTHHWEEYDTGRIRALREGRWQSSNLWGGVREGMVRIEGLSPSVPDVVRAELRARTQDIAAGRLHPFAGPVLDQQGVLRVPAGQVASDADILRMNYLVRGVQGALPR